MSADARAVASSGVDPMRHRPVRAEEDHEASYQMPATVDVWFESRRTVLYDSQGRRLTRMIGY